MFTLVILSAYVSSLPAEENAARQAQLLASLAMKGAPHRSLKGGVYGG